MKRTLPFWSWNGKLTVDELIHQIHCMHQQQIGGFFMHARNGLKTPYMSDAWMRAIQACIQEARTLGMEAWIYDEEGWPSGSGGGSVTLANPEFYLSWITFSASSSNKDAQNGGRIFIETSSQYADILNPEAVKTFIALTHEKYHATLPKPPMGFFTDEPQYAKTKIPYNNNLENAYRCRYGDSLLSKAEALFVDKPESPKVRYRFWALVNELFCKSYCKQIATWCTKRGYRFTGHLLREETLLGQMQSSAGVMSAYQYFDMPGIDWLGRDLGRPITPLQLCSVAEQLGKKQVISESFALSGWNISFRELKFITDWQFIYGINTICQHLESYTLAGFCKRDYPPSLFIQQSWWPMYSQFNQYVQTRGDMLAKKEHIVSILVIHPMHSAYLAYNGKDNDSLQTLEMDFSSLTCFLDDHQIEHHYGDETIIRDFGYIDQGCFVIGKCRYNTVILPSLYSIDASSLQLLTIFINQGGKIFSTGTLPTFIEGEESILELIEFLKLVEAVAMEELTWKIDTPIAIYDRQGNSVPSIKTRTFCDSVFILNSDATKSQEVILSFNNQKTMLTLEPMESILYPEEMPHGDKNLQHVELAPIWTISHCKDNALTLDTCQWRVGNGLWQPETPIIKLMETLLRERKTCIVEMLFTFHCSCIPETIWLIAEDIESSQIWCNDILLNTSDAGWWKDPCFRKIPISETLRSGDNQIKIQRTFTQDPKVYDVLYGTEVLESEKHRLTYETELESIYLVGSFGVYSKSQYQPSPRNAVTTKGPFTIDVLPQCVTTSSLVEQGFCFFSSSIELSQLVNIIPCKDVLYCLDLGPCAASAWSISINGIQVGNASWAPYSMDISPYLHSGENLVSVTLYASNRNLLGPHHNRIGESFQVGPSSFTDTPGWPEQRSNFTDKTLWTDSYCFVDFGIKLQKERPL